MEGQLRPGSELQLQLAARMDAGNPFAAITTRLEGNGFIAPYVIYYTMEVRGFISDVMKAAEPSDVSHSTTMPNVRAILRNLPTHVDTRALWARMKNWLKPGFDYAWKVMGGKTEDEDGGKYSMELFKLAQMLHPSQALQCIRDSGSGVNFQALLAPPMVRRLLGDTLCDDLLKDFDKLIVCHRAHLDKWLQPHELFDYWRENGSEMGAWAAAAQRLALCQPNSCLAERAGAIVRSRLSDQQGSMLEETFETTCQLAFRYAEEREAEKKKKNEKSQEEWDILTFWRRRREKVRQLIKSQILPKKKSQILRRRTGPHEQNKKVENGTRR